MIKLLSQLCALDGVSGTEDAVRDFIIEKVSPFADELFTDNTGNLIVFKKGGRKPNGTLLLSAHMDEVGLIVKSVTEEGYLKFGFVGGVDRRIAIGKRVRIGAKKTKGVIGLKAYHMVSREEEKKVPKTEDLYIDIGAKNKEDALEQVSLGDTGAFDVKPELFGQGFFKAKAIDDRIGCAALIKLIEQGPGADAYYAFTAMEEVGARGAFGAAFRIKPDDALVVEGTTAADVPGTDAHRRVCSAGKGAVLPFMDRGTVYDRGIFETLRDIAQKNDIPWQIKAYVSGGTDAASIQRTGCGARVGGIAAPVRYIHCPSSVVCVKDAEAVYSLLFEFVNAYPKIRGCKND